MRSSAAEESTSEKSTSGADRRPQAAVGLGCPQTQLKRKTVTQKINRRRSPGEQRGEGCRLPKSAPGWRTRENILAPEGPSGKEERLGEEALFKEQTAKGFPKSKKDGRPGVKKHESRARKFTTTCMWIFCSETSPCHRQKKTLTADEKSQVTGGQQGRLADGTLLSSTAGAGRQWYDAFEVSCESASPPEFCIELKPPDP